MPQPAGLTDQFTIESLVPLLLSAAVIAVEIPPSTTTVEAGGVNVTAIGFTVNLMLEVWDAARLGLTVDPTEMVSVHEDASDAAGG